MRQRWHSSRRKTFCRALTLEELELRTVLSGGSAVALTGCSPWQNPFSPSDLNADGIVSPLDALLAINALNGGLSGPLAGKFMPPALSGVVQSTVRDFLDANGDEQLTPSDPLQVINVLNQDPEIQRDENLPPMDLSSSDDPPDRIGDDVELLQFRRGFARVYAQLDPDGDVDVFRVIPEQARLHATLLPFSEAAMSVRIVDASGNELGAPRSLELPFDSATVSDAEVTPGDTCFIVVSGGPGVAEKYALQVINDNPEDYSHLVTARLALSWPLKVTAGVAVPVHIVALNSQSQQVSGYAGTVRLTSSDAGAKLPAQVTLREGHAWFNVTFAATGEQTLTVTDRADASLTATATTPVAVPVLATQFVVSLPSTAPAGGAVSVHAVALDTRNQLASAYTGTVSVTSSDSKAKFPTEVTFQDGHAFFEVAFATAGEQTLTVRDDSDASLAATVTAQVTVPAAATQFVLHLPPSVPAGTAVPVQVVVLDARNQPVPAFTGTVSVTSSDVRAALPAEITFRDGHALFNVTFATAGEQTLTVTDRSDASLAATATTEVAVPDLATQFAVRLPPNVAAGAAVSVQVVALNARSHPVPAFTGTVRVTSSDAGATLPAEITFRDGYAWFDVTFATAGSQTLTMTDRSDATLSGTATAFVVEHPLQDLA